MDELERAEQREEAERRLGILEAVALATSRRTDVLVAVGRAVDADDAELALQHLLDIGEIPAKAIMDMQVRRFTERERARLASMCEEERLRLENLK